MIDKKGQVGGFIDWIIVLIISIGLTLVFIILVNSYSHPGFNINAIEPYAFAQTVYYSPEYNYVNPLTNSIEPGYIDFNKFVDIDGGRVGVKLTLYDQNMNEQKIVYQNKQLYTTIESFQDTLGPGSGTITILTKPVFYHRFNEKNFGYLKMEVGVPNE